MPHLVILGAGISGLALAWYLQKSNSSLSITLVEKKSSAGGWIQTDLEGEFLFEKGPRGCRPRGAGLETLSLIEQTGLSEQLIAANPQARYRYLWREGCLQAVPHSLSSLLFSPIGRVVCKGMWKELTTFSSPVDEEESVDAFFTRRFGKEFASQLIDPLVTGIYAGDPRKLSMKACFPQIFQMGSLAGGILKSKFKKPDPLQKAWRGVPLFSLKQGMQELPKALANQLEANLLLGQTVEGLQFFPDSIHVVLSNSSLKADFVVSTLPSEAFQKLIAPHSEEAGCLLGQIEKATVDLVSFGFHRPVLPHNGFGYLVPSASNEDILGMVWDSCVFPQQNQKEGETRLTVMIGGTRRKELVEKTLSHSVETALSCLANHLSIRLKPDCIRPYRALQAIPQYGIGHLHRMAQLKTAVHKVSSRLDFLGSCFYGVSVNDCIAGAKVKAEELTKNLSKKRYSRAVL